MAMGSQRLRKVAGFAGVLAAVMAPIPAAAIPGRAGTQLFARLDGPVSIGGPCARLRAVLIRASDGESLRTAAPGIVLEGFAHHIPTARLGQRASLNLRFDRISTAETTIPANLRLFEIDNASIGPGAATHDIGISFRRRIFGFTHTVHAQIDGERSRTVLELVSAAWVSKVRLYDRADEPQHSRNATGDHLETDGRLALIELRPLDSIETAAGSEPHTAGAQQPPKP